MDVWGKYQQLRTTGKVEDDNGVWWVYNRRQIRIRVEDGDDDNPWSGYPAFDEAEAMLILIDNGDIVP